MSEQSPQKRFQVWSTELGELAFFQTERGYEMHREKCPHHQCWLTLKGTWTESSSMSLQIVRPGEFRTYRPAERNVRIAESTTIQVGFRLFNEQSMNFEWPAQRLMWRAAHSILVGDMNSLAFDEAISDFKPSNVREPAIPAWLKEARDYLHDNFHREISLREISNHVGITPNHLCSAFRQAYGVSLSRYRRRLCLESTLGKSDQGKWSPIKFGFYDDSHFHRTCKAELGLTPSRIAQILRSS